MVIAVFEDDLECAGQLEGMIRRYTHSPAAINTADGDEIIAFAEQKPGAALYILDIVKGEDAAGFDIAEHITALDDGSLIVFLTVHPKRIRYNPYFKTKAFSCIYKDNPALEQEVCETIRLAKQVLSGRCLLIHEGRFEALYLSLDQIYFIEAIKGSGKLCIHAINGRYTKRGTLKMMEKELAPQGFVRCHRSILLNADWLNREVVVDKSRKCIRFPSGVSCPYSSLMWRKPQ